MIRKNSAHALLFLLALLPFTVHNLKDERTYAPFQSPLLAPHVVEQSTPEMNRLCTQGMTIAGLGALTTPLIHLAKLPLGWEMAALYGAGRLIQITILAALQLTTYLRLKGDLPPDGQTELKDLMLRRFQERIFQRPWLY